MLTRTLMLAALFLAGCSTLPSNTPPASSSGTSTAEAAATRDAESPPTEGIEWSYPEMTCTTNNWVFDGYSECGEPDESPVALTTVGARRAGADVTLSPSTLKIAAKRASSTWESEHHNFGFSVGAEYRASITVKDKNSGVQSTWMLVDYHFHTPAEHPDTLGPAQTSYGLEMHVKSANASGNYAVFAVRFAPVMTGSTSWFQPLLDSAQGNTNSTPVDLGSLLDNFEDDPFFAYPGSLTTPPCTRMGKTAPVQFYVLQKPQTINLTSLNSWQAALNSNFQVTSNARGTQPMGTRFLTLYTP